MKLRRCLTLLLAAGASGGIISFLLVLLARQVPKPEEGSGNSSMEAIVLPGYIDKLRGTAPISSEQPRRVAAILVTVGQEVKAGEPLIQLENAAARLAVVKSRLAVEKAQLRLEETQQAKKRLQLQLEQQRAEVEIRRARLA